MAKRIILASQSPRRKQLLSLLDIDFEIIPSDVEEVVDFELEMADIVIDLAKQKALDVASSHRDDLVLGFDTIVVKDHHILGKPIDDEDARKMLQRLSNTVHQVYTGCAIVEAGNIETFYEVTDVYFKALSDVEITQYIKTNEPFDKAGAYAIQGYAARYIKKINGDYYTVMGMPLHKLYCYFQKRGD